MKTIEVEITEENYKNAKQANSGACLVADAIKAKYPQFTYVDVDLATVRVTDPVAGKRCIYLTPAPVGQILLHFDQGVTEQSLPKKLRIAQLVRMNPITRSASMVRIEKERRIKRVAELEAKEQSGQELSREEKSALTRMRRFKAGPVRPVTFGPTKVEGEGENIIIHGGAPTAFKGMRKNPQLLGGAHRHFGAKKLDASQIYKEQLRQEIDAQREAIREEYQQELQKVIEREEKAKRKAVEEALQAERAKQTHD